MNENAYVNKCQVLKCYINKDEDYEKIALRSLQNLNKELDYPSGLLTRIFFTLYNIEAISFDSFIAWLDSDDDNGELEGMFHHNCLWDFLNAIKCPQHLQTRAKLYTSYK